MYVEPKISSSYYKNIKAEKWKGLHVPDWDIIDIADIADIEKDGKVFSPEIGKVLYDYVLDTKPEIIVEFGVLYGFSTICMAQALRDLGRGKIYAYDLWDASNSKHGQSKQIAQDNLNKYNVEDWVNLGEEDLFRWLDDTHFRGAGSFFSADLVHIDVGNDGDLLKKINDSLKTQSRIGCDILFEGGTEERDNCWWMKEFNKSKMRPWAHTYEVLSENFPGLSRVIAKKRF